MGSPARFSVRPAQRPYSEGRRMAIEIPGARFVGLESRNHILLEHEPAWQRFQQVVAELTDCAPASTTSIVTRALGG